MNVPVVDDAFSSHEPEICSTTSLDWNCLKLEFQTNRNYYVDLRQTYLALKLKFVKDRGYETYKEAKREHKAEAKTVVETEEEEEQEFPIPLVTHLNKFLHSSFSNVEAYSNNEQINISNGLCAHKSYISNTLKGAISEKKWVLNCEGYDYEEVPDETIEKLLSEPFITRRMKLLSRVDGFMLYGKLGVDFFPTSELLYPNMKLGYDW